MCSIDLFYMCFSFVSCFRLLPPTFSYISLWSMIKKTKNKKGLFCIIYIPKTFRNHLLEYKQHKVIIRCDSNAAASIAFSQMYERLNANLNYLSNVH